MMSPLPIHLPREIPQSVAKNVAPRAAPEISNVPLNLLKAKARMRRGMLSASEIVCVLLSMMAIVKSSQRLSASRRAVNRMYGDPVLAVDIRYLALLTESYAYQKRRALISSVAGYVQEMGLLHERHLPPCRRKLMRGMSSLGESVCLHVGHRDLPTGKRSQRTVEKLPKHAPRMGKRVSKRTVL